MSGRSSTDCDRVGWGQPSTMLNYRCFAWGFGGVKWTALNEVSGLQRARGWVRNSDLKDGGSKVECGTY
ncbi:hypothetical protein [Thermomonospora umbrina]|nr:hypothetical protein [Thermomonospora umbrina]